MLVFKRSVYTTRPKTVLVQLLRGNIQRRYPGELFKVSEGYMRNYLHPKGLAAYILPNEEPPLPVLKEEDAQRMRREAKHAASLLAAKSAAESAAAEEADNDTVRRTQIQSVLDSLDFADTATASSSKTSADSAKPKDGKQEEQEKPQTYAWQNDIIRDIQDKN